MKIYVYTLILFYFHIKGEVATFHVPHYPSKTGNSLIDII
jgi:hypothetical protein